MLTSEQIAVLPDYMRAFAGKLNEREPLDDFTVPEMQQMDMLQRLANALLESARLREECERLRDAERIAWAMGQSKVRDARCFIAGATSGGWVLSNYVKSTGWDDDKHLGSDGLPTLTDEARAIIDAARAQGEAAQ